MRPWGLVYPRAISSWSPSLWKLQLNFRARFGECLILEEHSQFVRNDRTIDMPPMLVDDVSIAAATDGSDGNLPRPDDEGLPQGGVAKILEGVAS